MPCEELLARQILTNGLTNQFLGIVFFDEGSNFLSEFDLFRRKIQIHAGLSSKTVWSCYSGTGPLCQPFVLAGKVTRTST